MPEEERWAMYDAWAKVYDGIMKEELQEAAQALETGKKQIQVSPWSIYCICAPDRNTYTFRQSAVKGKHNYPKNLQALARQLPFSPLHC